MKRVALRYQTQTRTRPALAVVSPQRASLLMDADGCCPCPLLSILLPPLPSKPSSPDRTYPHPSLKPKPWTPSPRTAITAVLSSRPHEHRGSAYLSSVDDPLSGDNRQDNIFPDTSRLCFIAPLIIPYDLHRGPPLSAHEQSCTLPRSVSISSLSLSSIVPSAASSGGAPLPASFAPSALVSVTPLPYKNGHRFGTRLCQLARPVKNGGSHTPDLAKNLSLPGSPLPCSSLQTRSFLALYKHCKTSTPSARPSSLSATAD